jgi:glycosyltransferase involved in cell wall biosynthesis
VKVSVSMITYNHENFIAQAIDSILMQQVNFDYEVVIGEDCSTDNTRDIVIDYQNRYPDKIHLLLHKKNVGAINNEIQVYKACQGEYIAWLEGDDYWTSPHKLQKQSDFLDNHPECSSCFHSVVELYEDGRQELFIPPPIHKKFYTLENLFHGCFIDSCSFMFRNHLWDDFPDWFYETGIGDFEQFFFSAQNGYIGYIDEAMGVYRAYGGFYTTSGPVDKLTNRIKMFENINAHLNFKYDAIIKQIISQCHHALAVEYAISSNLPKARKHLIKSVSQCPINRRIPRKNLLIIFLRLYFPIIYRLIKFDLVHNVGL